MPDIDNDLLRRVEKNDPAALWEYSRILEDKDSDEALKYLTLAAQLNYPPAIKSMADKLYDDNKVDEATHYYKMGAKAGLLDCSVKLAVINLDSDEGRSLLELEELAEMGVESAAKALADYYASQGNKVQHDYWSSLVKDD